MNEQEYGVDFKEHFLEQYKLYVEMADNVSSRRDRTNHFYIAVISGLLAVISFAFKCGLCNSKIFLSLLSSIGILFCVVWFINIKAYSQLNSGKFKVIHEMEKNLPFPCYDREWVILGRGKEFKKYLPLTHIEQLIPFLFAIPFIIFLFFA